MKNSANDGSVQLDLNDPLFQRNLFGLPKPDRHSALEALGKLSRMTWMQVYSDNGLKWEKVISKAHPAGVSAVYSLRITQSRRATAYRDGDAMCFISISPDHDSTYGKK
jgi:hypothetical protein